MTTGEIIQIAVSAISALICLYVRSEMEKVATHIEKLKGELSERIYRLENESLREDGKIRDWVRENFQPQPHRERG